MKFKRRITERVGLLTSLMRTSQEPFWLRLRNLFEEKGLKPGKSSLADCFPDDNSFAFGIVASLPDQVYQFGFEYSGKRIEDGILTEWEKLLKPFNSIPHQKSILAALEFLEDENN